MTAFKLVVALILGSYWGYVGFLFGSYCVVVLGSYRAILGMYLEQV